MKILDLGCGTAKVPGAIGVDRFPLEGVDVVHDLREFPYPFPDNEVDVVYLNDVIEHLPDTIGTMEEVYRICKSRAKVFIRVLNWNSPLMWSDPTHVRAFTDKSFDFFGSVKGREYYTKAQFIVNEVKYQYNHFAINYCPSAYRKLASKFLSNILEGLLFELIADKPGSPLTPQETLWYKYAGGAAEQYLEDGY